MNLVYKTPVTSLAAHPSRARAEWELRQLPVLSLEAHGTCHHRKDTAGSPLPQQGMGTCGREGAHRSLEMCIKMFQAAEWSCGL